MIIYNNISSHGRTGEVSRFYHQLNFESDYKVEDFGLEYNILSKYTEDFKIMKSDEILSKMPKQKLCLYLCENPNFLMKYY